MCASELIFSVVDIKKLDNGWQILYSLIYLKKKKKKGLVCPKSMWDSFRTPVFLFIVIKHAIQGNNIVHLWVFWSSVVMKYSTIDYK